MLPPLDPARTAVLGMDFQQGIVSRYVMEQEAFLGRVAAVLAAARSAGMRVIYVRVGFRSGLPEVGSRNPLFAAIKSSEQAPRGKFTRPWLRRRTTSSSSSIGWVRSRERISK